MERDTTGNAYSDNVHPDGEFDVRLLWQNRVQSQVVHLTRERFILSHGIDDHIALWITSSKSNVEQSKKTDCVRKGDMKQVNILAMIVL